MVSVVFFVTPRFFHQRSLVLFLFLFLVLFLFSQIVEFLLLATSLALKESTMALLGLL